MAEGVTTLSDKTFDEEIGAAETPILVDFWAEWCGPCKMIAPVLEEIAEEHSEKIHIGKLNVDEQPGIAEQYGIRSIPSLLFFQDGKVVDQVVGAAPKKSLAEKLTSLIPVV